ncbi:MAG TPA: hypothetical protein VH590_14660 [Ktedonobacterales bacterium]|jgi:hypothetical protein
MASIFLRHYLPSFWNPQEVSGPCPMLTLREWEAGVALCSLPPALQKALVGRLTTPPPARQPTRRSDDAADQGVSFVAGELRKPVETLRELFRKQVKAIRRTLDTPLLGLHGISRETRLVAQGARLRQISEALGEHLALQEIAALPQPEPEPPQPAAFFRQRWGGRWAAFFDGAGAS